ncbi:acyl-CoA synthetase [Phaeobacter gallaeciensis]|uniref:Long-chain-fatty-acid--CoA ligase FadD n=1 Tax=Phaeobacter gallaeciensis TaxID=60890 RepID=A0AAC9Z7X3_9RHOB|nr:acyl-CoA synthetase [Phaeobacter gallaeciensis]AHD08950.1 Acyl-CoA synthetase (AMP-forming)/AMP-acid ligase II [Phaeobacter gallaeciensis DSM 26640]ATE92216.1 long-chain-fatty-acid--CoA ligase FadD [Phaeobacter gallaeciensis]ATE97965.1 long-chain-fatty-acid--CoA ligase FadD [Phaeobacter gallaeciensis]ATF00878.1 long-chain-fatty-acid--CoA ligase FadD [Phaeobacter gallaeciensis]ATF05258.1 long-chain-fatty-acid--CoA ligase FadD [Phaeobacter gallaeciensis]
MGFATAADCLALVNEMPFGQRNMPTTLYGLLSRTAGKYPDNKAVSYQIFSGPTDKAETLTWRQLKDKVTQAANMFRSMGIGEKDVVAYILPNCNETVVTLLGGAVAGIANPINPLLEPEQIASILRETGAKVVVTLKPFPKTDVAQKVAEAVRHAPKVNTVLEIDLNRYLTPPKSWIVPMIRPKLEGKDKLAHADYKNFNKELRKHPTELTFADSDSDRVACYFHTGGTTGMPKVAQHTYSGMNYNGWLGSKLLFTAEDNIMCPLPLFHVFACHVILMAAVASGAHVVFPTPQGYRGDGVFDNFWKLIERWKISFIITVPTAISAKMQRPVDADVSTVKTAFSGSAPLPVELFKRFEQATGVKIVEGYGLTEATCLVSCNPVEGEKKIGSIGIPLPYTDVKIVKGTESGTVELGVDEIGEICISSPGVYAGHTYTEVEKNDGLFYKDQYLRTGDLGKLDSDGYLWITGRAKDLIIRGGHNIDPAEIEEALLGHEAVAFAGAIGQPDAHAGEVPCAFVELVDGASVTAEELLAYCKIHVHERAAIPKHVTVMDELPKTAVGKVFKPDLRKNAITRIYNDALLKAGLPARVEHVVDDKGRGLVAQVEENGAKASDISDVLGVFTRPWEPMSKA